MLALLRTRSPSWRLTSWWYRWRCRSFACCDWHFRNGTTKHAESILSFPRPGPAHEPRGGRRDGHALSRRPYFRIICVDGVGLCDQSIACARRACRRCQSGGAAAFRSVRSHRFRLVNQRGPYNVTNYSNPARDKIIAL